jgi:phosphopantetheine--protein transferase-like protein
VLTTLNIGLSVLSSDTPKAERRKQLSAEGRRILSLLAGRTFAESDILRGENGRPYFPNCDEDINISHSGRITTVSFVKGSNVRTGCDVQKIQSRANTKKIAEEFFSVSEKDYIFSQKENGETRFFEIWTLKECFIKLRGLSIFDMAKVPSFINVDDSGNYHFTLNETSSSPLSFYLYELASTDEQYILAVAIEGAECQEPEIKGFSQSRLIYKLNNDIV